MVSMFKNLTLLTIALPMLSAPTAACYNRLDAYEESRGASNNVLQLLTDGKECSHPICDPNIFLRKRLFSTF